LICKFKSWKNNIRVDTDKGSKEIIFNYFYKVMLEEGRKTEIK
jgi:hypothetical protein